MDQVVSCNLLSFCCNVRLRKSKARRYNWSALAKLGSCRTALAIVMVPEDLADAGLQFAKTGRISASALCTCFRVWGSAHPIVLYLVQKYGGFRIRYRHESDTFLVMGILKKGLLVLGNYHMSSGILGPGNGCTIAFLGMDLYPGGKTGSKIGIYVIGIQGLKCARGLEVEIPSIFERRQQFYTPDRMR